MPMNEFEEIYNKYAVYEHAAPDPFTITIPYIPVGTTITFDR